jgi:hypothetical protein
MTARTGRTTGPSVNKVRRRLGSWYRAQIRDRVGPLPPPVADFSTTLQQIGRVAAALTPLLEAETRRVIADLIDRHVEEDEVELDGAVEEVSVAH